MQARLTIVSDVIRELDGCSTYQESRCRKEYWSSSVRYRLLVMARAMPEIFDRTSHFQDVGMVMLAQALHRGKPSAAF